MARRNSGPARTRSRRSITDWGDVARDINAQALCTGRISGLHLGVIHPAGQAGMVQTRDRGRLRPRHHRLDGPADRGRQTQNLVDRHHADRLQSRRRNPHGARRLSRHRRRLRDQDVRSHHRHPGSLCRPAAAAREGRRRLAGERQRSALRWRQQDELEPRPRLDPHHLPGRRRAATDELRAGP